MNMKNVQSFHLIRHYSELIQHVGLHLCQTKDHESPAAFVVDALFYSITKIVVFQELHQLLAWESELVPVQLIMYFPFKICTIQSSFISYDFSIN
jgi:hypothetical protein